MSYNNPSFYKPGGPGGMTRGRGYSGVPRGTMRGVGTTRGSDGSWRGRGRGFGVQSRGAPGSVGTGGWTAPHSFRGDRYSSGSRPTDTRYQSNRGSSMDYARRYSRQDAPSGGYTSRDHHRSPDAVPRKRMRPDGYLPASSRRSHEGSYEYSSSRYEYGSDKSHSNEDRDRDRGRPVYREERGRDRRPSADRREDYHHHSPRSRESRDHREPMPLPPPPIVHRGGSTYRARGVGMRGRGVARGFTRRPAEVSLAARKRSLIETYAIKRRILTGRTTDYLRRLKSMKLRSAALLSARKAGRRDSEDELENWDDDTDGKDIPSDNDLDRKTDDDEDDEIDGSKRKKIIRKVIKKVVPKKTVVTPSDEVKDVSKDEDEIRRDVVDREAELDGGEEEIVEEEEVEVDQEDVDEPKMQVTIKQDSETRAVSDEGSRKVLSTKGSYRFIRLFCPHCKERYITFKDYQSHLRGAPHINAMRKLSLRLKHNLARMRVDQRIQQRVDEKNDEIRGVTGGRTNFCHTCKLNYRQERARHIESEMHKKMKEFLMPSCVICRVSFRSPMLYENHICSLDHIKVEERMLRVRDRDHHAEKEVDMDSLLVLDSVGSADESESDNEAKDEKSEETDKKEKKKKEEINLGGEYVKPIAVLFCELCGIYLPRTGEPEVSKANHCRTRNHLQRYVRCKNDTALRKEAERIHRRDKAEQEARHKAHEDIKEEKSDTPVGTTQKPVEKDATTDVKVEKSNCGTEGADTGGENLDFDDKIWADVDKGLDELLAEVDEPGNKSSDDDEESGRFDRFRYSDKKGGKTSSDGNEDDHAPDTVKTSSVDSSVKQEQMSPKPN